LRYEDVWHRVPFGESADALAAKQSADRCHVDEHIVAGRIWQFDLLYAAASKPWLLLQKPS